MHAYIHTCIHTYIHTSIHSYFINRLLRPGGLFLFSEPDGDSSFLESVYKVFLIHSYTSIPMYICQVFPERISNKVATAGEKATRSESFSSEKKTKNKKIRNSRDSSKKKRGGDDSSEESSATTATIEDDSVSDSVIAVDNSVNTIAATTTTITTTTAEGTEMVVADSSSARTGDKDGSTRPAVTVERLSNVFFPYITGIAVRP